MIYGSGIPVLSIDMYSILPIFHNSFSPFGCAYRRLIIVSMQYPIIKIFKMKTFRFFQSRYPVPVKFSFMKPHYHIIFKNLPFKKFPDPGIYEFFILILYPLRTLTQQE